MGRGNVTDVMSSQASGRGKRSFFHRKTQKNGQVGEEAEVSDRNYFSKQFCLPLSPYCKIENNFDPKGVFYMLFLEPDQSAASSANIFLEVPKCA